MRSLLLNNNWDLTLDVNGNLAVADPNYSIVQNVATAITLFRNEAYFNTDLGIAHFDTTFRSNPNYSIIKSRIREAVLKVPGVKSASLDLQSVSSGGIAKGVINIVLDDNSTAELNF